MRLLKYLRTRVTGLPIAAVLPVVLLATLPPAARGEFHFQRNSTDAVSDTEQQLAAEISAFLNTYATLYNNQDYRGVKSMWFDDGNPIYMAEEVPFPLYGKERLANYFNPVPGRRILDGIENRYSRVRAKYVAPNIAVATYRLDYDLKLRGMAAVHGWDRVMAVLVKDESGWKLSAYTEAPQGPATMVRKMMQAVPAQSDRQKAAYKTTLETIRSLTQATVSPGFDTFLQARKNLEPVH